MCSKQKRRKLSFPSNNEVLGCPVLSFCPACLPCSLIQYLQAPAGAGIVDGIESGGNHQLERSYCFGARSPWCAAPSIQLRPGHRCNHQGTRPRAGGTLQAISRGGILPQVCCGVFEGESTLPTYPGMIVHLFLGAVHTCTEQLDRGATNADVLAPGPSRLKVESVICVIYRLCVHKSPRSHVVLRTPQGAYTWVARHKQVQMALLV